MLYVLLDDQGTGEQFVFRNPQKVIQADHRTDLPRAFAEIEAAQKSGKWLAGWMSYELGYALETKFQSPNRPLINLGVFDAPCDHPPAEWLYTRDIPELNFKPNWSEVDYLKRFTHIQKYLRDGDCYQVNLTFPMMAESDASPAQIYAAFRRRQPGRYGAVVSLGATDIISFSPELFFERKGQNMRMRPMKGTRPRSADPIEDAAILAEMRAEPKSQAENLMIVDLLRNDLSRLCKVGSVEVPELFALETYPTLHQMTSQVTGVLEDAVSWFDIFKSLFPCGSVTGAPKIRAMEIIKELEGGPREAYCGSVGYIAPNGDASFSVAIRTIQMKEGTLRYDVGSGVVLDSDGPDEYRECILKSQILSPSQQEGLIETFRHLPNGNIPREKRHFDRLAATAGTKLATHIWDAARKEVNQKATGIDARIRILAQNGQVTTEITPYIERTTPMLVSISRYALNRKRQVTNRKTSLRDFYEGERSRVSSKLDVDEVVFLNDLGDVCEGSFTSIFVEKHGKLLTPALSCGLLPGVLRAELIDAGKAIEAKLTVKDLETADAIFLGNSLRGLIPANFVDFLPH